MLDFIFLLMFSYDIEKVLVNYNDISRKKFYVLET